MNPSCILDGICSCLNGFCKPIDATIIKAASSINAKANWAIWLKDAKLALKRLKDESVISDPQERSCESSNDMQGSISPELKEADVGSRISISNTPSPALPEEMWAEPDATSFLVRGKTYVKDRVKVYSNPALFKLLCVDLFQTDGKVENIASHPKNRVFQALQRRDSAWTFVVNIMIPGPPYYALVLYFSGDESLFEQDTPFARVAKPFFRGDDNTLRDNRFKLIPRITVGNMIIKMAVKNTPTLLGNKLKQTYHKGSNYFEMDVDVSSSSIARHVVGLLMGYSKAIVVDVGMCLQGNDEDELSEVIMGGFTCVHLDMAAAKKL